MKAKIFKFTLKFDHFFCELELQTFALFDGEKTSSIIAGILTQVSSLESGNQRS